jgi:hypothetical protein
MGGYSQGLDRLHNEKYSGRRRIPDIIYVEVQAEFDQSLSEYW